MRNWDLTGGAAKLELALQSLEKSILRIDEYWNDDANRQFQALYVAPLTPKIKKALDAVYRLQQILTQAEQECGDY